MIRSKLAERGSGKVHPTFPLPSLHTSNYYLHNAPPKQKKKKNTGKQRVKSTGCYTEKKEDC